MKKRIAILLCVTSLLTGCMGNQTFFANNYAFNKAMIKMADDTVITVDIDSYSVGNNSAIIFTKDGRKYCVAYTDVTFFNE